ncbi:MAG: hypothetical protein Q4D82_05810 [Neisseria sp.]|nr:hypothetical protein [Neisseria sp.]
MNPKMWAVSAAALLLAACAGNAPVVKSEGSFNPAKQARVRLYGQNQQPTFMLSGIDCAAGHKGRKDSVGASIGDAFGSLSGASKSHSLGMAETEASRNIGQRNGILSKAVFREFAVEAGKPANVRSAFNGLTTSYTTATHRVTHTQASCRSREASFVPKAGKDYEVLGIKGGCGVAVFEVSADGRAEPVELQEAVRCNKR